MMKRIPPKLTNTWIGRILLKSFRKKIGNKGHPDGFLAEIITDKNETYGLGYGINILECGICKLFKKYDYEKYASILCEVDEITSGMAGLKLIRPWNDRPRSRKYVISGMKRFLRSKKFLKHEIPHKCARCCRQRDAAGSSPLKSLI